MQKTLLIVFWIFFNTTGFAQLNADIQVIRMPVYRSYDTVYSYGLYGEKADLLLMNLRQLNNCNKGSKGISRFRCQHIVGLEKKVTLKVHEGIETTKDGETGFNTFYNKKYRSLRIEHLNANEKLGIRVYVKHNGRFCDRDVIDSVNKNKYAITHLEKLLQIKSVKGS